MADEKKHKHLEFIQGVIIRLSTNSFVLKGWSVTLISALFALSAADSNQAFIFLAYIPAIVFWGLDGFFLWQEQLYRKLYDDVRISKEEDIDFSMDTSPYKTPSGPKWFGATFSKTLFAFHVVLICFVFFVLAILCLTRFVV